jgi:hypothetical protein
MLMPGYIKGWKTGTELDRDGFKHLMNIELRRKVDSRGPIYEIGEAIGMGCRASWGRGLSRLCCSKTRVTGSGPNRYAGRSRAKATLLSLQLSTAVSVPEAVLF